MKHLRTFISVIAVPAIIMIVFAVGSVLATPPQGKSTICHTAGDKFVQITVSNSALAAHMRHGDVPLDEYGECP